MTARRSPIRTSYAVHLLLPTVAIVGLVLACADGSAARKSDETRTHPEATALSLAVVEYYDPDARHLWKMEGRTLFGEYVGERRWWHRNQHLSKVGEYDDNGRETGEWTEYHPSGVVAARYTYALGDLVGVWRRWAPNGELVEEGRFERGQRTGRWREWYDSGAPKLDTEYRYGRLEGSFEQWFESGARRASGQFELGQPFGLHEEFAENGQVLSRKEYSRGRLVAPIEEWHESGVRRRVAHVEHGELHGEETLWWPNGGVHTRREWERGERHGLEERFHRTGTLAGLLTWDRGRQHGVVRAWHGPDRLASLATMDAGQATGLARKWSPSGQLLLLEHYVADQRFGTYQEWYPTGARKVVSSFEAGELAGPAYFYDESGAIQPDRSGVYLHGRKLRELGEDELERGLELCAEVGPIRVPSTTPDPLERYGETGHGDGEGQRRPRDRRVFGR